VIIKERNNVKQIIFAVFVNLRRDRIKVRLLRRQHNRYIGVSAELADFGGIAVNTLPA
jgi:hypothetical protein